MDNDLKQLVDELFEGVSVADRCPFIKKDELGPYCAHDLLTAEPIGESRRLVCDVYSLQLWCLDKERCSKCIHYTGIGFS